MNKEGLKFLTGLVLAADNVTAGAPALKGHQKTALKRAKTVLGQCESAAWRFDLEINGKDNLVGHFVGDTANAVTAFIDYIWSDDENKEDVFKKIGLEWIENK